MLNKKKQSKQFACAIGVSLVKKKVKNGTRTFNAVLDSGASINVVTRKAAKKLKGERIYSNKFIRTVGSEISIKEAILIDIEIGNIKAKVLAYIVKEAPADILLGVPFLKRYSKGFNQMVSEFSDSVKTDAESKEEDYCKEEEPQKDVEEAAAVAAATPRDLEALLDKYPDLVLGEDQLPNPKRYYKHHTFELGLPKEKRSKRYYRPQYPPDPTKIEIYRKILEPLIRAGVYVPSNSPHNNPVMLVPKKQSGQYRLVVDNRLVNAECRPVGSMSAAPLGVIRTMQGAKIFTTLDCKNAFYSLELAKKDREFTAISPPGMERLELTRMPMGAKASTAALYQAMVRSPVQICPCLGRRYNRV